MSTADAMTEKEYLYRIIQDQLRRHPGFGVEDLYKMVCQATCGGDHLLKNRSEAKRMLREEWENSERIPKGETLLEMIDPRGEVMRVNLRVYKKIGGTLQRLFDVFVRSAQKFEKDRKRLVVYWEAIMKLAEKEEVPFSKDVLEDFWIDVGRKGFPAVHHSDAYVDANRPSYRVVLKRLWEGFEKERESER